MRKIILFILFGIFLILSGCSSKDIDTTNIDISLQDNIYYEFDSMSFTNTSEADILYLISDQYLDFKYVYYAISGKVLSSEEELAYQDLFIITKSLESDSNISLSTLLSYSSSEFNDAAEDISIILSLQDIVLFNSLKIIMSDLEELTQANSYNLSRIGYIEYRLGINLTDLEILSLELLQEQFSELYLNTYEFFNIRENTFEDLLVRLNTDLNYVPSESDSTKLETAYSLIEDIINE